MVCTSSPRLLALAKRDPGRTLAVKAGLHPSGWADGLGIWTQAKCASLALNIELYRGAGKYAVR